MPRMPNSTQQTFIEIDNIQVFKKTLVIIARISRHKSVT